MGDARLHFRFADRCKQALAVGVLCGCVGVLVDLDHVVCVVLGISPLDPAQGIYGCRLWHIYLLPAGGLIACIGIALGIGLLFSMVGHAARPGT